MKIYRLTQGAVKGYDTFNGCIVAAPSEDIAKTIQPTFWYDDPVKYWIDVTDHDKNYPVWSAPEHVTVEYLGEYKGNEPAVLLCSFNAG